MTRRLSSLVAPLPRLCLAVALAAGATAGRAQSGAEAAASAAPPVVAPMPAPAPAPAPAPLPVPLPALPASPDWQALSAQQKQILASLEPEWNQLDPSRRGKWLELAARYPQMPEEEQQRVQQRLSDWVRLSPAERQQARLGFQAARQLKADERQAKWEAYQALPEEMRQRLLDKASQKQKPAVAATAGTKPEPAAQKPNLVPLLPKSQPEQPFGPTVLQAKPGVTTVLINQQGRNQARQPQGAPRLNLDLSRLDAHTLLPRPAKAAAQQQ